MMLAAMFATICCTNAAAQGPQPKLNKDNKVEFTVRAPEAHKVQVDLGGMKYDMQSVVLWLQPLVECHRDS